MPVENFIVYVFIFTDNFLKNIGKIRRSGPAPELTDSEVITMEIVGEFLGCGKGDKTIFDYFYQHWYNWFPKLNCRTTFSRQSANLWKVKAFVSRNSQKMLRVIKSRNFNIRWFTTTNLSSKKGKKK